MRKSSLTLPRHRAAAVPARLLIPIILLALLIFPALHDTPMANAADGDLRVEILAGYNLVVDSNAGSPSTYAPSAATVIGRFCNDSGSALTNVWGYVGNYTNTTTFAAGVYPARDSATFPVGHPLRNTGVYYFTHMGGGIGLNDARRFIGTIPAGQCRVQYWHFSYPQCSESDRTPPCSGLPVWGDSIKPEDDLWLQFDVWGTSDQDIDDATWTMTMRNEISAMANKIKPNPDGDWFNTKGDIIEPGGLITSNGILYELGVINQGFDNDGDYVPDYNAWLQPVGDASYDPSCFRIVRVSSVLTVTRSGGNPDMVIHTSDLAPDPVYGGPLYFTHLPPDNTGTRGEVFYTFQAMVGPCSTSVSPYQEVASGYDNEKFNADYGVYIPPLGSTAPMVTLDKTSNPTVVAMGGTTTYRIPFANLGTSAAGLGLSTGGTTPVVISDTIPAGMRYSDSDYVLDFSPNTGVTIRSSTDSGATWQAGLPPAGSQSTSPNQMVIIQWWLNDSLPPDPTPNPPLDYDNYVVLTATVPASYAGPSFIDNCADARFGTGVPFAEACAPIMVQGNNRVGDWVWRDENTNAVQDDGTTGINAIAVSLYWDRNGDGALDANDVLLQTMDTYAYLGTNGYYTFTDLPDANYLVVVDSGDSNLPVGYGLTTPRVRAVALDPGGGTTQPVVNRDADFGFGPSLKLQKTLTSENPAYEGDLVTYRIALSNNLPGDGTGEPASCTYMVYAQHNHPYAGTDVPKSDNNVWQNEPYALYAPDSQYATLALNSNDDDMGLGAFDTASQAGNITKVELVAYAREIVEFKGGQQKDTLYMEPWYYNAALTGQTYDSTYFTRTAPAEYVIVRDITSLRTWDWPDFSADRTELLVQGRKGNQSPYGQVGIDAVAYRITTDQQCGEVDGTIDPLPLTDTFDPTKLQFLSATPPETSVAGGTVSWDNLGPLYPGQTKYVYLTFEALPIAGNTPISHQNCGDVTDAYFVNGRPVNDASSCVTHDINPTAKIGDFVWHDLDNDGVQDGGEPGIPNVRVYLCAGAVATCNSSNAIQTTWTDASGLYYFEGARNQQYTVAVDTTTLPPGWTRTYDADGTGTPDRSVLTIANAADNLLQDFGYRFPPALYGNVWEDADGDSNKETGDTGIPGVTVYLCTSTPCTSANAVQTTTTDANGNYLFGNLSSGTTYYVGIANTLTPLGSDWVNTRDPEGAPGDHQFAGVTVVTGLYGSYDFGYYRGGTYRLGDTVYTDWDGDATQDAGEEGIPNITVSLYEDDDGDGVIDPEDGLVAVTVTNSTGNYYFPNRGVGSYIVVVDKDDADFPAGYRQTQDPDQDGIVCTACDNRGRATLGPNDLTVDFGYQPYGSASIGDFIWRDLDHDGVQDGGSETGIASITVNLYEDSNGNGVIDAGDALVATTSTDANGNYLFDGLHAGRYLVDVDTTDPQLPTDGYGNRYVLSTDNDPHPVTLATGQDYRDADFGFTPGGLIGDYIWQDSDGDGIQDEGEPGIAGVTVNLYAWNDDGDGVYEAGELGSLIASDTTGADGIYEFTSRPAGLYVVRVDTTTLPSGFTQTGDPDLTSPCSGGSCDSLSALYLAPGQVDRLRDFGYQAPVNLGDYVWIDADRDGVQDAGEAGIGGVVITLTLQGGTVLTTTTDSDGYYSFGNVPNGTHVVSVRASSLPVGVTLPTWDYDGTGTPHQATVTISGASNWNIDFGYDYNGPNSVSGTVFHDDDNDAIQDSGETWTYADVTIYLWHCGADKVCGTADDRYIGAQQTNSSGDYSFTNLPDGRYVVSVNPDAPKLLGTDPTVTTSPTTYREVNLDQDGGTSNPVSVTDQDFGFLSRVDLGDLPDSYGTTLANDGARHVPSTLYLGNLVDTDPDGQETVPADGDDSDGTDDEDGVKLDTRVDWSPGSDVTLTVTATGSSGYLVGFFDWNEDGDFSDPGETVAFGALSAGSHELVTTVPTGATLSQYANARFRLYNGEPEVISPKGLAPTTGGEVEDYRWPIGPTAVKLISFTAAPRGAGILVTWETATELDNLGFHLYRSTEVGVQGIRLNEFIIPSQAPGQGMGASYQFVDASARSGVTYYYTLEDIDVSGQRTAHGPVSATGWWFYFPLVGQ